MSFEKFVEKEIGYFSLIFVFVKLT